MNDNTYSCVANCWQVRSPTWYRWNCIKTRRTERKGAVLYRDCHHHHHHHHRQHHHHHHHQPDRVCVVAAVQAQSIPGLLVRVTVATRRQILSNLQDPPASLLTETLRISRPESFLVTSIQSPTCTRYMQESCACELMYGKYSQTRSVEIADTGATDLQYIDKPVTKIKLHLSYSLSW